MAIDLLNDPRSFSSLFAASDKDSVVLAAIKIVKTKDSFDYIATNRHHLVVVHSPLPVPEGLWNTKTNQAVEGNYPNYEQVIPPANATLSTTTDALRAYILAGAAGAKVGDSIAWTLKIGPTFIAPHLLLPLTKLVGNWNLAITVTGPLAPIRIDMTYPNDEREFIHATLVVMPIKKPLESPQLVTFADNVFENLLVDEAAV